MTPTLFLSVALAATPEVEGWLPYADAVSAWAIDESGAGNHATGSALFDAEWDLGACQMTVLGLGQVVLADPDLRERYEPGATACMDWLMTPEARSFGAQRWGEDAMDALDEPGRDAWMGYVGMALGVYRLAFDAEAYAPEHRALAVALAVRLAEPVHHFQTYPREVYPVDQSTCAAAVALFDRVEGNSEHAVLLDDWAERWAEAAVDRRTGLVYQSLSRRTGRPVDSPRGSGTALSIYALSFLPSDEGDLHPLPTRLYRSMVHTSFDRVFGVAGMREYPPGVAGRGDIDSGPIVAGLGVSATGFSLAGARLAGDEVTFEALWTTARTFGAPVPRDGGKWFLAGDAVGNAILLAMITAGS